jgi:hypothetical protein
MEHCSEWWSNARLPVLNEVVVRTASGVANGNFWESFCKCPSVSGGECVTGWAVCRASR